MGVSLLINSSLNEGSQLPYIERALRSGYGVLVLNTNDNTRNGRGIPVRKRCSFCLVFPH